MCSQASSIAVITAASSSGWAAVTANSMVRVPRSVMALPLAVRTAGCRCRVSAAAVATAAGSIVMVPTSPASCSRIGAALPIGRCATSQRNASPTHSKPTPAIAHRHHHVSIASTRPATVTDCGGPVNRPACQISAPHDEDHADDEGHDAVQCGRCARHVAGPSAMWTVSWGGSARNWIAERTAASISAVLASTVFVSATRVDTASFRRVAAVRASKTPGTELAAKVLTPASFHGEIHTEDVAFTANAVLRDGRTAEITRTRPRRGRRRRRDSPTTRSSYRRFGRSPRRSTVSHAATAAPPQCESTARLVEGAAVLGDPELVHVKGSDQSVRAQRLLGVAERHRAVGRAESNLVGRRWEMAAVEGLLERAIDGHGAVVGVVGSPGIGKSRLVREVTAMAAARGVDVFTAFCESHTNQIPFHAVTRLLRAVTG